MPAKPSRWRRFYQSKWRWPVLVGVALVIAAGSYYVSVRNRIVVARDGDGASALSASKETDFALSALNREGDARVNILLLGKGGANHAGGNLTDSIQLLSVDIFNHTVGIVGIPRDLLAVTDNGSSKINAVYSTAEAKEKGSGGQAIKEYVGTVTDTTVHYFAVIDFSGLVDMVDAIGGIDINVPKTLIDTEYPADDGSDTYETFKITAGQHHMDGALALKYVRSRHSTSDFDRLSRQQQVISAIKDKVLSAGIVTNPSKLTKLMEALADNLRTDMTLREITVLFQRISEIDKGNISSIVLGNGGFGSVNVLSSIRSGSLGSVQQPTLGPTNYSEIQQEWHKIIPDPLIAKEAAKVRIQYGATKSKTAATDLAEQLTNYGYTVSDPTQTSEKITATTLKNYRGDAAQYTTNYLSKRLGVDITTARSNDDTVDIDILLP